MSGSTIILIVIGIVALAAVGEAIFKRKRYRTLSSSHPDEETILEEAAQPRGLFRLFDWRPKKELGMEATDVHQVGRVHRANQGLQNARGCNVSYMESELAERMARKKDRKK